MLRYASFAFAVLLLTCLAACNRVPEHAQYIPSNAVTVVGIHSKPIIKKIAWEAIWGSELLKELKQDNKQGSGLMDRLQESGIKKFETYYIYMLPDNKFSHKKKIVALLPLSSIDKWNSFVKQEFPEVRIVQNGSIKEAMIKKGIYAGWNKHMVILMNTLMPVDTNTNDNISTLNTDEQVLHTEILKAFNVKKDQSVIKNKKFVGLEKGRFDVTVWTNYEQMMKRDAKNAPESDLAYFNTLWKDAALTAGFRFNEGEITGDIQYYMPSVLQDAAREFGKTDLDKELVDNLPGSNRNVLLAWHLSPVGLKELMGKTGMLGFINLVLKKKGLNANYILDAFTGDIALSINDFSVGQMIEEQAKEDSLIDSQQTIVPATRLNYIFALKIKNKDNFHKLLQIMNVKGNMLPMAGNALRMKGIKSYLTYNDQYFVMSNSMESAGAFLRGEYKESKISGAARSVYGYPFGLYMDVQHILSSDSADMEVKKDYAGLYEGKKYIESVSLNGGKFKGNSFYYYLNIALINKKENSLLQLIDFVRHRKEM